MKSMTPICFSNPINITDDNNHVVWTHKVYYANMKSVPVELKAYKKTRICSHFIT